MSEHLTESAIHTVVTAWCNVCSRHTRRIAYRDAVGAHACKPGPCLEHQAQEYTKAQIERRKKEEEEKRQPSLF